MLTTAVCVPVCLYSYLLSRHERVTCVPSNVKAVSFGEQWPESRSQRPALDIDGV